jgi:uncharacterized protein (DUF433 family)
MVAIETTQIVPLVRGEDDAIRIVGSRVTLDSVIRQYKNGATAEQIKEDFPSLQLPDVYSVIAYYLKHPQTVEQYLQEQEEAGSKTRDLVESSQDTTALLERLRRRRTEAGN